MQKDILLLQLKTQNCEALPKKASQLVFDIKDLIENQSNSFFDNEFNANKILSVLNQLSKHIQTYMQIPNSEAVTLIVKDGKTAKQLFIESIEECKNQIVITVANHTQSLSNQFNNDFTVVELKEKIDFFRL